MLAQAAEKNLEDVELLKAEPEQSSEFETVKNFARDEWDNFKEEINRQIEDGNKVIDFGKAARNALYLTKIDRAMQCREEGRGVKMTMEELEKFVNEKRGV